MTYICSTANCAIALSNATFPVVINCPVCQNPLVANNDSTELTKEDIALINSLPYVIAYPLKQTLLEKHPWTKINLLKDTFLNYLKYIALLSASEFFNSEIKDKGMVALFHKNLMETAFGKWNNFIRECLLFLKQQNHNFFYPELLAYYEFVETGNKAKKYKGEIEYQDENGDTQYIVQTSITSIGMLINFRNRYLGHGLTLDADKSEKLWNEYFPIFRYLLEQMSFTREYPMLKREEGETYELQTSEIKKIDSNTISITNIWIQNKEGAVFEILPFFIVPGEVSLAKEDKEQLLTYESYTGKTIKFFSPEGTEKQTSGKILEKLNLLLREKQKEIPFTPETFTKEEFLKRIAEENKLLLENLIAEKKIISGVYQHREEIEIKLREWIGARANIFFIAAEAGSGKTNLLVEIQSQYAERGLPSLLIRAGRMEKKTLKEQIAYLVNINQELGLVNYTSIAGTQAQPTFILIDGLNEANNAEEIWQEILDISKVFEPGSLKFIITNRANTKADLERYEISENDQAFLYGENKENEKGLGAYSFWLTALDMQEMKGAWNSYATKNKAIYKPLFTFDDIAIFDRGLYNQINNPLILRLFLELYNGKSLPKKGAKHLHIWHDWLKAFSQEEQKFLKLLADEIWVKGENELLLDDLLKHEILKPYFTTDIINSPYLRLQNKGWISRYIKGLNAYIGITVEGALLYLLGVKLQQQVPAIDIAAVKAILSGGNKLLKSAIESFLCEQALNGDLKLVADLIDAGNENIDLSIKPLLLYLKSFGVKTTLEKVLENPSENDWKALLKLNNLLNKLHLFSLKIEFCNNLYNQTIVLDHEIPIKLLLNIIPEVNYPLNLELLSKIEKNINSKNINNEEIVELKKELAYYYTNNGFAEKGLLLYKEIYPDEKIEDSFILNEIGAAYNNFGLEEEALKYYNYAKEEATKLDNYNSKNLAQIYFNIAGLQKKEIDKIKFYEKSLEIELIFYGLQHTETARTISAIGLTYIKMNLLDQAFTKFNEALLILNKLGSPLDEIYIYFGHYYEEIKDNSKALEFYERALELLIVKHGVNSHMLIGSLLNIAHILEELGDDYKAIDYYEKANGLIENSTVINKEQFFKILSSLGLLYFQLSKYDLSINYLNKAVDLHSKKNTEYSIKYINNIYYYLGYAYYLNCDYAEAEKVLLNLDKLTLDDLSKDEFIDNFILIGNCFFYLEMFESSLKSYFKILPFINDIKTKFDIAKLIASCFEHLGNYESAIEYYDYCLNLALNENSDFDLLEIQYRLGICFQVLKDFSTAIIYFKNGFDKEKNDYFIDATAKCYEALNQKNEALNYYIQSAELRRENIGIENESTQASITNAKRLAKELNVEIELPEWIKEI